MGEGYKPPNNAGCLIAFLPGFPLLLLVIVISAFEGGRCEGMGPNCQADHFPMLSILLAIVIGSFGLAWGLNAFINRRRG